MFSKVVLLVVSLPRFLYHCAHISTFPHSHHTDIPYIHTYISCRRNVQKYLLKCATAAREARTFSLTLSNLNLCRRGDCVLGVLHFEDFPPVDLAPSGSVSIHLHQSTTFPHLVVRRPRPPLRISILISSFAHPPTFFYQTIYTDPFIQKKVPLPPQLLLLNYLKMSYLG